MVLTKQYLRYVPGAQFGLIGSLKSNIVYLELRGQQGKYCAVATGEHVTVWDIRKSEKVFSLPGEKHEVTILGKSPDKHHLAVGYDDGSVKIFNLLSGEMSVTFSGHKSAVTALAFDADGTRLASGSRDTEVIVWDTVNEAGMFRLRGHKGPITQCYFVRAENFLVTSSRDTFIKFWDLDTQHCFKTLLGHRTEVWGFVVVSGETRLISGSADNELRVWKVEVKERVAGGAEKDSGEPDPKQMKITAEGGAGEAEEDDMDDEDSVVAVTKLGSVFRKGRDRVASLSVDATGTVVGCHGNDTLLELFKVCTADETKKRLKRRQKKARKKLAKGSADAGADEEADVAVAVDDAVAIDDEITRLAAVHMGAKLRSFDVLVEPTTGDAKIVALLGNNSLEEWRASTTDAKEVATSLHQLAAPAHRTDARAVAVSADGTAILSASGESAKLWNRATLRCVRTMACGYALCCQMAPGDRHAIVGTKAGALQLFDVASASLLESVAAHDGALWSMCVSADRRGLATGGADKQVKFWDFDLVADDDDDTAAGSRRLGVVHRRTLRMSEDVLCVRFSPDGRLVAVSLLDSTVKVFFVDTLKFFLSLYGHKLPALALDISSDSTLLVTASADRNVKLWGLDFGDCHRSMFAHDDSVTAVQFVPGTHLFFTAGRDGRVKQWDGDTFEKVVTLDGHHGEVWALAVAPAGAYVVTAAHDRSLRVWERTDEPLVLQEEQETEREAEHEAAAVAEGGASASASSEAALPAKKTIETVKAAERLMEAIEIYREETTKEEDHAHECLEAGGRALAPPPPHPLLAALGGVTATRHAFNVLRRVRSSELEVALLVLPLADVRTLVRLLVCFLERGWDAEFATRCVCFLLRAHHPAIVADSSLQPVVERLRSLVTQRVGEMKDLVGFNAAGLSCLQQRIESSEAVTFFADATGRLQTKKKRARKAERAVIAL
ncbi:PREDICTED: WD repeat-containing protein 3-like [Priapulus caudatus]|uniref:WD repeat-containing protein 3-like n=1 Tax=Priapulus caudatus TaxID=37621 RepID=A0ABM1EHG1_PRICU|nr:PREDICTED: WD repeat-containing protein 3-like [Priapulus caudatus]